MIASLGITCNDWRATPWPLADELHPTDWVVAESCQAVADADADRPLFQTTSFYAPHPPLFPPRQYHDAYRKQTLPQPAHGDWVEWESLSPDGDEAGHRLPLEGDPSARPRQDTSV